MADISPVSAAIAPVITSVIIPVNLENDTYTNTHYINKNIKQFYKLITQLLIKFKSTYNKEITGTTSVPEITQATRFP